VVAGARRGFPGEHVTQPGTAPGLDADAETALRKRVPGGHLLDEFGGVLAYFDHWL
jgi:hypothetical protein